MFLGLGQRLCKVDLENLVMPESKEVLQQQKDAGMSQRHGLTERALQPKLEQFEQ